MLCANGQLLIYHGQKSIHRISQDDQKLSIWCCLSETIYGQWIMQVSGRPFATDTAIGSSECLSVCFENFRTELMIGEVIEETEFFRREPVGVDRRMLKQHPVPPGRTRLGTSDTDEIRRADRVILGDRQQIPDLEGARPPPVRRR